MNSNTSGNKPTTLHQSHPNPTATNQDDIKDPYSTAELQENLSKLTLGFDSEPSKQANPYTNEQIHFEEEATQQLKGTPKQSDGSVNDMYKPHEALFNHPQMPQGGGNMQQFSKKDMDQISQMFNFHSTNQSNQGNKKQSPLYSYYATDLSQLQNNNNNDDYNLGSESHNFIKKSSMEIPNKEEPRRNTNTIPSNTASEMKNPFTSLFTHPQGNEEYGLDRNMIRQNFFTQGQGQAQTQGQMQEGQEGQEMNPNQKIGNFYSPKPNMQQAPFYNQNNQSKPDPYNFVMWDNTPLNNPNDNNEDDDGDDDGEDNNNNDTNNLNPNNKYAINDNDDANNDNPDQPNNDLNNDTRSINSDDYIFEKFGKKGWMCEDCSNFNFQNRKECNKCHIPKKPKLIKKNSIQNQPLFPNPFRTQQGLNSNSSMNRGGSFYNQTGMEGFGGMGMNMGNPMGMGQEVKRRKPFTEREGDWHCPECQNLNFSFRQVCNRCKTPKQFTAGNSPTMKHPHHAYHGNTPNNQMMPGAGYMNNPTMQSPMGMNFGMPSSIPPFLQSSPYQPYPQNYPQQDSSSSPFNASSQMNFMNNYYNMFTQQNMLYQQSLLNSKGNPPSENLYKKK